MIKLIVRDIFFLGQKSEPATEKDKQVIQDKYVIYETEITLLAAVLEPCTFGGSESHGN